MRTVGFMRMRKALRSEGGYSYPLAIAVVIGLLMLMLAGMEFMKLAIMASGVRDAMEQAIVSVITDNYNETYHCVREGYAGGYEPTGAGFYESVDLGDIRKRLCGLLALRENGAFCERRNGEGTLLFRLSGIEVNIRNTRLRNGGEKFSGEGAVRLEIPVTFNGRPVTYVSLNLRVKALMREKF